MISSFTAAKDSNGSASCYKHTSEYGHAKILHLQGVAKNGKRRALTAIHSDFDHIVFMPEVLKTFLLKLILITMEQLD